MPFVNPPLQGLPDQIVRPPQQEAPGFGELFAEEAQYSTSVGQLTNEVQFIPKSLPDPNFDPYTPDNIAGYEDNLNSFLHITNADDMALMKRKIDLERENIRVMSEAGLRGVAATIAAGMIDPLNLVPVGGQVKSAYRLGRVAEGAFNVARTGLLTSVAGEAISQATQETRTAADSAYGIAATTLLSGVLGGAASAFSRAEFEGLSKGIERDADIYAREFTDSVGAMRAGPQTTMEQETLSDAFGLEKVLKFQDPLMRTTQSEALETRRTIQDLAEIPLRFKKNEEGIASPIAAETQIKRWQGPLSRSITDLDNAYTQYRIGRNKRFGDIAAIGAKDLVQPTEKLGYMDFREAVGKALRRGDQSEIPEVAQAAKSFREKVFDPLKKEAIDAGLLPEDVSVDTALSYFTRVYNTEKIVARRPEFENKVASWLGESQKGATKEADNFLKQSEMARGLVDKNAPQIEIKKTEYEQAKKAAKQAELRFQLLDRITRDADLRARATADKEAERISPVSPDDPLLIDLKDLRRGNPKEPRSLLTFLHRTGGLRDEGGELANIGITNKARPGLVRNEKGANLDEATLKAWEAGYFPEFQTRPEIDDLLTAIRDEMAGNKRYSQGDQSIIDRRDYLSNLSEELDRAEISLTASTDEDIVRMLRGELDKIQGRNSAKAEDYRAAKVAMDEAKAKAAALKADIEDLDLIVRTNKGKAERFSKAYDSSRVFSGLMPDDLRDIASQITDNLLGAAPGRVNYSPVPLTRGPLKERTLGIPDEMIEDFLVSDVDAVSRIYTRTMSADVELTKKFGRADMQDQIQKVRDEYARRRAQAEKAGAGEKEFIRLNKALKADIRDLEAMRDRIRGTYKLPDNTPGLASIVPRTLQAGRNLNYLSKLGGQTLSSLGDAARAVMAHGLNRSFKDGLVPLVTNLPKFKLAADEVKLAGTALNMVLDSRAMSIGEIADQYAARTRIERGVQAMANSFGVASLMSPWNAAMKQFAGVISQTRSLQAIEAIAKGATDKKEMTRLAQFGIDKPMALRIAKEFKAHGEKERGVYWANTSAWTDREAANAYQAALVKEVDKIIVTPGQDKPLWMSTEMGKTLGQFKSFAVSSAQRVLLSGLQERDMAQLNGLVLTTGLGALSYYLKTPEEKRSSDIGVWIKEGVDRGGVTGWFFDANNTIEKLSSNTYGISPLLGQEQNSRYASRNKVDALLGPSFGLLKDTVDVGTAAATGDWKDSDTHKLRRMVPFQNLFYARQLFDAAEGK